MGNSKSLAITLFLLTCYLVNIYGEDPECFTAGGLTTSMCANLSFEHTAAQHVKHFWPVKSHVINQETRCYSNEECIISYYSVLVNSIYTCSNRDNHDNELHYCDIRINFYYRAAVIICLIPTLKIFAILYEQR